MDSVAKYLRKSLFLFPFSSLINIAGHKLRGANPGSCNRRAGSNRLMVIFVETKMLPVIANYNRKC